ncbi:MAG: class I SAM-dependent methyltransferase [Ilumatobacter sp.]|uniref:RsmG family class I SAM-dependent methyltransferase n=1 Tax=Ilumatobacter sp. TaxID=1967498 RepID=UPI002625C020|nr:RsmG family class I SAM-dependent methyltransferase [Ilumatobacter sp.]MDJ0771618.1 class I SAM-dependent methyltransferase [Ilumatobacter sp.]
MHPDLLETLRDAQRFGFFGPGSIEDAAAHAAAFVEAIAAVDDGSRIVDLGSGGGLPGLVVADARRGDAIVLIDRRQKRTDFLERAVRRLGFEHVDVWCADVDVLCDEVGAGRCRPFDVVTARGFGPPATTLRTALRLLAPSGRVVISEPPTGDRWSPELLAELGVESERHGPVAVFRRREPPGGPTD